MHAGGILSVLYLPPYTQQKDALLSLFLQLQSRYLGGNGGQVH